MTPDTAHYQAVGLVRGIYSDKALHIRQGSYPAVGIRKAKWHLETIENKPFRFLVYPRFDLKAEALKFQILAWSEFQDEEDEWKLAGLWQFIPQLRRPVLAVHRNEKHWDGDRLKSCYLPFVWKGDDSPRPWRFNPKASKEEQGHPLFLSCTATLDKRFPRFFMKDLLIFSEEAPKRIRAPKAPQPPKEQKVIRKLDSLPKKVINTPGETIPGVSKDAPEATDTLNTVKPVTAPTPRAAEATGATIAPTTPTSPPDTTPSTTASTPSPVIPTPAENLTPAPLPETSEQPADPTPPPEQQSVDPGSANPVSVDDPGVISER
ncbi:hypothetical protein [Prochlorothrix hollandica]|uniref:hypothetical protein n=1 Tax=Prochlorothrix hollandica TaxID=1223 RepID=UPI0033422DC1